MDTLIIAAGIAFVMVLNILIMYVLGHLLTGVINVKPFSCRACLTFWLTLTGGFVMAFIARRYFISTEAKALVTYALIGASVLAGLVNFFYIKSKFHIYE